MLLGNGHASRGQVHTYRVTEGATVVSCKVSSQARGYQGPVAVQLEDVDVVRGAVGSSVANEIPLHNQFLF